jgi:hypothetical protein
MRTGVSVGRPHPVSSSRRHFSAAHAVVAGAMACTLHLAWACLLSGFVFPPALVEIQHATGLDGEGGITRENPAAMPPRPQRILAEPTPQRVVPLISATNPCATASRRNSVSDQRAKGRPRRDGNSQASALISTLTAGEKWAGRPLRG